MANPWKDNEEYPASDWKYEVGNDDTRLGYLEWVEHQQANESLNNQ